MTDLVPSPKRSRPEPLSLLWRIFAAPQTLMVLLGLCAVSLALSTLIPQVPPQARGDIQTWLAVQSSPLTQGTDLLQTLGLFDVLHSLWFRVLLVLTGLVLLVWLVESAELAVRIASPTYRIPDVLARWAGRAPITDLPTPLSIQEAGGRARACLADSGFRCSNFDDDAGIDLVASRRSFLLFAKPVAIAALLVALGALALLGYLGWQSASWQPAPHESRPIGHDTPYSVRFDAFKMERDDAGRITGTQSHVAWLDGNTILKEASVSTGHPSKLEQLAVRQTGYVPAITLRGWDAAGQPLVLQQAGDDQESLGEIEIVFPSAQAQPLLFIPSEDLYVALTFQPVCVDGRPELLVDLLPSGGTERQTLARLHDSDFLTFDGLQLDIDLDYRPILRLDYQPAVGLVFAGLLLALAAQIVAWLLSPRLVWITAGQSNDGPAYLRVLPLTGPGMDVWLPGLVDQLREAVTDVA